MRQQSGREHGVDGALWKGETAGVAEHEDRRRSLRRIDRDRQHLRCDIEPDDASGRAYAGAQRPERATRIAADVQHRASRRKTEVADGPRKGGVVVRKARVPALGAGPKNARVALTNASFTPPRA
jgi:hypothetical protein